MKLTKKLLEQMIREAAEDDPQQWLSPDVEEDDTDDIDHLDYLDQDPSRRVEPLRDWLNDILIRRVQDALRDAAKDIAEEVYFDEEYKRDLFDAVGVNIEEDLMDFLRPIAELLAYHNQRYPDPLRSVAGVALRNMLSENKIEEGDVIDLGAEREKRASEKEREEVDLAEVEEKASELAQSVLLHLLENKFVEIGEPPYKETDPIVVFVDDIRESLKALLLSQGGGLSEGVLKEGSEFDERLQGMAKVRDIVIGALEEHKMFPLGEIPARIVEGIENLSLKVWDAAKESTGKNHAQVSEAQFQMARADMESKMLEDAAKNILNVLLLKHKLTDEDKYEYKEDIKSGIEKILKMLRSEMV